MRSLAGAAPRSAFCAIWKWWRPLIYSALASRLRRSARTAALSPEGRGISNAGAVPLSSPTPEGRGISNARAGPLSSPTPEGRGISNARAVPFASLSQPARPAPPLSLHAASGLVEPDVLEAVEQRRGVLLEALDRGLGEVDPVGREEPEVRHVLEDQDLHAVIDLLALPLIHGAPVLFECGVDLRHAPGV